MISNKVITNIFSNINSKYFDAIKAVSSTTSFFKIRRLNLRVNFYNVLVHFINQFFSYHTVL